MEKPRRPYVGNDSDIVKHESGLPFVSILIGQLGSTLKMGVSTPKPLSLHDVRGMARPVTPQEGDKRFTVFDIDKVRAKIPPPQLGFIESYGPTALATAIAKTAEGMPFARLFLHDGVFIPQRELDLPSSAQALEMITIAHRYDGVVFLEIEGTTFSFQYDSMEGIGIWGIANQDGSAQLANQSDSTAQLTEILAGSLFKGKYQGESNPHYRNN